jgi:RNA 3'-terminal phosphate cyclase (ATP)
VLELDGSDAGGGYLRSALSLAALSGRAVTVEGVRGSRPEPGLKPQHLAAVQAVAAACDATVEGAELGSETVVFEPEPVAGGTVDVTVDTAGSIGLVFDALLPLATRLDDHLRVSATGGTDVLWAPPLSTYRAVKLPLLRSLGLPAAVDVDRRGFYPAGGGAATLSLAPADPPPLALTERGDRTGVRVRSLASESLSEADVAERQAEACVAALEADGATVAERTVGYVETASPGSVCTVRADYEESVAGFDALGEQGKPAEDVGREAASDALAVGKHEAAVDEHLADQLLVVLAVAGGELTVPAVTDHVRAGLDLLDAFGYAVDVAEERGRIRLTA